MLSDEEFSESYLKALRQLTSRRFSLEFGGTGGIHRPPPYLSSLASCARRTYLDMKYYTGEAGEPAEMTHPWQVVLGYSGQELVTQTLEIMGYTVSGKEKAVEYAGAAGRIDGILAGFDLDDPVIWDCKLRNSFAIKDVVKLGLPRANPEIYVQMQGYMAHEGLNKAIVTFHPFDISDARSRLKQSKIILDPHVVRVIIEASEEAQNWIADRVLMLQLAMEMDVLPAREYNPETETRFPCPFCPYKTDCMVAGQTDFVVTPIPLEWKDA